MARTKSERQKMRNEHRDSWIAVEAGDTVMGKLVDVTDAWSAQRRDPVTQRQGSLYPLLTVMAEEATGYSVPVELKVHCFGAVLYNEVMRKRPNIGERIRITYQGTGEAKEGQNPPELYRVRAAAGAATAQRAYDAVGAGPTRGRGGGGYSQPAATSPPVQPELDASGDEDDDIPF